MSKLDYCLLQVLCGIFTLEGGQEYLLNTMCSAALNTLSYGTNVAGIEGVAVFLFSARSAIS